MKTEVVQLYTIGHSNYPEERFLELLKLHEIEVVFDVRSHPYSGYSPQFNRETIEATLSKHEIGYVYVGWELGGRTEEPHLLDSGRVNYQRLAKSLLFQRGLETLLQEGGQRRGAMMCAEKDPMVCHRSILISRNLLERGIEILHILEDAGIETHDEMEQRLLKTLGIEPDLFSTPEELLAQAYEKQASKIAYVIK